MIRKFGLFAFLVIALCLPLASSQACGIQGAKRAKAAKDAAAKSALTQTNSSASAPVVTV